VFVLATILAIVLAALAGYVVGSRRRATEGSKASRTPSYDPAGPPFSPPATISPSPGAIDDGVDKEKARIIRSLSAETWGLRDEMAGSKAASSAIEQMSIEREKLVDALTGARAESARYRQLVIDIENKAPPPILLGAAEPDDLKMIVGIGPVLERMLHNLGVGTFRQIARWSERDVAEFDAKLPEFPGRIVRDQWVTQARALHESKYGERP